MVFSLKTHSDKIEKAGKKSFDEKIKSCSKLNQQFSIKSIQTKHRMLISLLCGKALDALIALGLFEQYHFDDLDLCPTNHLLKWCVEVLAFHEFNFFQRMRIIDMII